MAETNQHPLLQKPDSYILGETDEELFVDNSELSRAAALRLVSQAQNKLLIITRNFDPLIYNNRAFVDAVSVVARRSRHSDVRILVHDRALMAREKHLLVALAQRLKTYIHIREVHKHFRRYNEAFLLVDSSGVLHRKKSDLYEGTVNFKAPALARELGGTFRTIWEHSQPNIDLRATGL